MPPKPQAAVNFPVCEGDSIKLSVGNIPGVTWSWSGPGSFTSTDQNPNITNAGTAAAGDYVVIADNNGCISKDTVAVTVNIKPAKPVALSNTPICAGAFFILGASTSTPGVSWNWIGPGSFTSTLQNPIINTSKPADSGDYIVFASLGGCSSSDTVNAIIKATKPLVTITSNPSPAKPGVLNNFNALVTNGGSTPTYQWRRNGAAQGGAINANWSVSGLHPYDKITCQVTSSDSCASPKTAISNEIVVNFPTGIDDVKPDQCALYPNPNDGKFILSLPLTPSRGGHISVEVVNVVGQVVYSLDIPLAPYKGGISISLPENVVSGVYLLRVKRGDEVKTMRFTVTR